MLFKKMPLTYHVTQPFENVTMGQNMDVLGESVHLQRLVVNLLKR